MLIYYLVVLATLFPTVFPISRMKSSERERERERVPSALRIEQPPTHFTEQHTHTHTHSLLFLLHG